MIIVDLTHFFPFTFISHLARALFTFNIINAFLKFKNNIVVSISSIVGVLMLFSYFSLLLEDITLQFEYVILALYYILVFVLCIIFTKGSIPRKIVATIMALLTQMISLLMFDLISKLFYKGDSSIILSRSITLSSLLTESLFLFASSFVFAHIIKSIIKKLSKETELTFNPKNLILFIFPLTHIFCAQIVVYTEQCLDAINYNINNEYTNRLQIITCVFIAICFISDILLLFVEAYINKNEINSKLYQQELVNSELAYQQLLLQKEEQKRFYKIRHDITNLLTISAGFIEIEKPKKALEILKNTTNELFDSAYVSISKSETINTIYSIKQSEARKSNANIAASVLENAEILISDYDLCKLLTNIIDNAINAVKEYEFDKTIDIRIEVDKKLIKITSKNRFVSSSSNLKNSIYHGYGQTIIKEISKKYNGKFTASSIDGFYTIFVELENLCI